MKKEFVLALVQCILSDLKEYWIRELNTEGEDFNYDSQDVFRQAYEDCVTKWKLIEKYPPEVFSDERIEVLNDVKEELSELIGIYEKHKDFFRNYNREKLMLDTYRKNHPIFNNKPDTSLTTILGLEMEIPSKDKYYKSTFYKQYGFLLNDYHFEIYVFCKYLLNEIKEKFKYNEPYKTFIENAELAPYFPMKLISVVYEYCNNEQFDFLTELEFYTSFNLLSLYSRLRIGKNENKRAYYVLHKFSICIKNKEIRNYWINEILNRLGKSEANYLSKYRDVVGSNATEDDKKFVNDMDAIFKPYII